VFRIKLLKKSIGKIETIVIKLRRETESLNQTKVASYAGNFQIIKANSVGYKMITWQDRKGMDDSVNSKAYLMIPQGKN